MFLIVSQQVTHSNRHFFLLCTFSYAVGVNLHLDALCVNIDIETKRHKYDITKPLDQGQFRSLLNKASFAANGDH